MKKLLLIAFVVGNITAVFASTNSAQVTVTGALLKACTVSLNSTTINITLGGAGSASNSVSVGCNPGDTYSLAVASQNGFQFKNSGGSVATSYTLNSAGNVWTGPIVNNATASSAPTVYPFTVVYPAVDMSVLSGSYSDIDTFTVSY